MPAANDPIDLFSDLDILIPLSVLSEGEAELREELLRVVILILILLFYIISFYLSTCMAKQSLGFIKMLHLYKEMKKND